MYVLHWLLATQTYQPTASETIITYCADQCNSSRNHSEVSLPSGFHHTRVHTYYSQTTGWPNYQLRMVLETTNNRVIRYILSPHKLKLLVF